MYCKVKGYDPGGLIENPEHTKVLAILRRREEGEPTTVVVEANWPSCTNPLTKLKNRIIYHDPSLENEKGATITNGYYLSYREVEIINSYDNNRKAAVMLEEEY